MRNRSEVRVQIVRTHAELVEVRLTGHDGAGGAQSVDHGGIVGRGEGAEDGGGASGGAVGGADVVFDGYEAAIERRGWWMEMLETEREDWW